MDIKWSLRLEGSRDRVVEFSWRKWVLGVIYIVSVYSNKNYNK